MLRPTRSFRLDQWTSHKLVSYNESLPSYLFTPNWINGDTQTRSRMISFTKAIMYSYQVVPTGQMDNKRRNHVFTQFFD
jgi:hypothetical protein